MNKCETLNLTIQRLCNKSGGLLPPEYQQVEYIEHPDDGSADPCIVTSVPLTNTYYFMVQYMLISSGRRYGLFGSTTTTYPIGAANSATNGRMIISTNKNAYLPNASNVKYTVEAYYDSSVNDYRAFIDGTEASYRSDSGNTANNGFSLYRSNWVAHGYFSASARIYRVIIKESIDGNTTLDLYPCYRKSDNKPGMYDLVNNTFYTNDGTGEFTVGADV